jgi:acetyltransferase
MTMRNLDTLLRPRSVAIVGASSQEGALGHRVLENVLDAGFEGPVFTVNPKQVDLDGDWWVPSVADIPIAPDLAIIATPAATVPDIIAELGAKGTKVAVVISAGFHDPELRQAMLEAAQPHLLRVVGPNCLGVLMPHVRLNGSFAQAAPHAGGVALLSQSGALVTSMIDWANERDVGFSGIVSLGDGADVDFGDLIDLFAADPKTEAIALYVESITHPNKFMSAARAAARIKPVIALKAGRTDAAGHAAFTHTGAIVGSYDVHLAAFRRAGIVVVDTLSQLFDATQMLGRRQSFHGNSLAIVTNGGGAGVLAADAVPKVGGVLAQLSPETVARLDAVLPAGWSRSNPIDVVGDARAERFAAGLNAAAADAGVDAVLVIHCPTAVAAGTEAAQKVIDCLCAETFPQNKPVIACWMGPHNADAVRPLFAEARLPLFDNLDDAVQAFGYLIEARAARASLMRAPAHVQLAESDRSRANAVIAGARRDGRDTLTSVEAKAILEAFGVPVQHGRFAQTVGAVRAACTSVMPPFALKIVSPELSHKSDVGGVALDLPDASAAVYAAEVMAERIAREHPSARLLGFEIETMVERAGRHEVLVGLHDDPTFGPVIAVGAGGKAVEVLADRALGIPPLDEALAHDMISRTRVSRLLSGYRDVPAADVDALVEVLLAGSRLATELPDIAELDINPLMLGTRGAIVVDARMRVTTAPATSRMVIRPSPVQWSAELVTRDGVTLQVRPVAPDDEPVLAEFFRHVSPEDLRFRFLSAIHTVSHDQLAAMTQIDYHRAMHFLAFAGETLVASAFLVTVSDRTQAELALTVRAGWKHRGISWTLMQHVLRYALAEGIGSIEALESSENHAALRMERELGFTTAPCPGSSTEMIVRKVLQQPEVFG